MSGERGRYQRGIGILRDLLRENMDPRDTRFGTLNDSEASDCQAVVHAWDKGEVIFREGVTRNAEVAG